MTGQAAEEDNARQSRHPGVTQQAVKRGSPSNMISLFQDKSKQGGPVRRTSTSPSCIHQRTNRCTAWAQVINENSWVMRICPGRLVVSPENRCRALVIGLIPELPPDCPENSSFFLSSRPLKALPAAFSSSVFMPLWRSAESYRWDPPLLQRRTV